MTAKHFQEEQQQLNGKKEILYFDLVFSRCYEFYEINYKLWKQLFLLYLRTLYKPLLISYLRSKVKISSIGYFKSTIFSTK